MPGNGWGMTETMATVTAHVGEDYLNRPDSAGPPVPVADLQDHVAPDGATELARRRGRRALGARARRS